MASVPKDPAILFSFINTKLRDQYSDLSDLCLDLGLDEEELKTNLAAAGFTYDPEKNKFS